MRILPHDMEQGLKEFASGVEQLVDRLVSSPILREGKLLANQAIQSSLQTKDLPQELFPYRTCAILIMPIASYCSSGRC